MTIRLFKTSTFFAVIFGTLLIFTGACSAIVANQDDGGGDGDTDTDTDGDSDSDIDVDGAIECTSSNAAARCGNPDLCVDGFCCDGPCEGGCSACNLPGEEGKCLLLNDVDTREDNNSDCPLCNFCDGAASNCVQAPPGQDPKQECDNQEFCDGAEVCGGSATCVTPGGPCLAQACNEFGDVCFDCTPTGPNEDCTDGIDNNCDGYLDCPMIVPEITFPEPGRATNFVDLFIYIEDRLEPDAVLWCRSAHVSEIDDMEFYRCPYDDTNFAYFDYPGDGSVAPRNGRHRTDVYIQFGDTDRSETLSYPYYHHGSLMDVARCEPEYEDMTNWAVPEADFFSTAATRLDTSLVFQPEDVKLHNPFISVNFEPPLSASFGINEGDGPIEFLSLRRSYKLNADRTMLLMTRQYTSTRSSRRSDCLAGSVKIHGRMDPSTHWHYYSNCDAVVFNKKGAGACIAIDGNELRFAEPDANPRGWSGWVSTFGSSAVDHFLWRKLVRTRPGRDLSTRWFSPKCHSEPSCVDDGAYVVYLEDYDLFN